jgi:hypothetical protein
MTIKPNVFMKKLFILMLLLGASYLSQAQETKPGCDKTSCGPEGTKKAEAVVITAMRNDLQAVIAKMSKSAVSFDKDVVEMEITKGGTDDECLLYISQAASAVRFELVNKVDPSKLNASLKNYKPGNFPNKQKMVSGLKKEIELLTAQVQKL